MSARRGARSGRQPRVLAPGRRRLVVFIFPLSSLVLLNSVYNHDAELFPASPDKEVARSLPTAPRLGHAGRRPLSACTGQYKFCSRHNSLSPQVLGCT